MKIKMIGIGVCILLITIMLPITATVTAGRYENRVTENEIGRKQIHLTKIAAKEWTFLLYNDADFENAWDPFSNFTSEVYGGDNGSV